jgi:hypothetical protein
MDAIRGWPAVIAFVALAIVFVVIAILYWTATITILATPGHTHHVAHTVLFGILAVIALVAASMARPQATPTV